MNDGFRNRLLGGFLGLVAVFAMGTFGYFVLGGGEWGLDDCFYMTVITLTTVGYAEILPGFSEVEHARPFTMLLLVMGMGVFLYFASTVTAFIIEGELRRALQGNRMRKRLARIRNHIIVCGVGSTGRHVVAELMATKSPMVAIDSDLERLTEMSHEYGEAFLYIHGDATDDHILEEARLEQAAGLAAVLANDKDNLYLVVSARQCHSRDSEFRIVARGIELSVLTKMRRAGANAVVSPNFIGGMRMASEMLRPEVVRFLDVMLRDSGAMRIDEVEVAAGSDVCGQTIRDIDLRSKANVSILAMHRSGDEHYQYNPSPDMVLEPGMLLVVLGGSEGVARLRKMVQ